MINTCIILAGPTAVGKTAVAIELARYLQTEIISADSRQCFRELSVGVAKPSAAELALVRHHFIDSHSIHDPVNAATFEHYALDKISGIFAQSPYAVMAGGTGLYLRAFAAGMDPIPPVDDAFRNAVMAGFAQEGIKWLQQMLSEEDPLYADQGEMQNPQRMMRALEVVRATGRSILHWQTRKTVERPFRIIRIGLELPRPELYQRINYRVDQMLEAGLENEVAALRPHQQLNALQTVGYREWWPFFEGLISRDEVKQQVQQNTRHYAKRQLTWFRKEPDIQWVPPDVDSVLHVLRIAVPGI